jgi:hypothetical protein
MGRKKPYFLTVIYLCWIYNFYAHWYLINFMYRRRILCTLYGAVDFLNVLKKGWWGGGGCLVEVHSEIHYKQLCEGWEEVVVRNVLHYVPIAAIAAMVRSLGSQL